MRIYAFKFSINQPSIWYNKMVTKRPRRQKVYEGKAKILYTGPQPGTLIQYFKDDATAFNNKKHEVIAGKGILNNRISEFLMTKLTEIGIPNHFIKTLNMREQLIREVEIIPLEVIVRNFAAGSLCRMLNMKEGTELSRTLIEFCYKKDELGDPLVSEEHAKTFGWADELELDEIKEMALRINDFLYGMFGAVGIRLIDFKIEFGRLEGKDGFTEVILADEISPDSCRLWDIKTNKKLDKDRFRCDLGGLEDAYKEVATRLGILIDPAIEKKKKEAVKKADALVKVAKVAKKAAKKTTTKKKDIKKKSKGESGKDFKKGE